MQAVTLASGSNDEVEKFTYLGNLVSATGGTDQDVQIRLVIAWSSFSAMESKHHQKKKNIFNSDVKVVLLYASKSWNVTQRVTCKIQGFIDKCLGRVVTTLARHNQQP